jgi:hypothetical protein
MGRLRLDREFVLEWSSRYLDEMTPGERDQESHLFDVLALSVQGQGFFTRSQFLEVGRWKALRATGPMKANSDGRVQYVTGLALSPANRERASTMTALAGVGLPMASALLTVWQPENYAVYDDRAQRSLERFGFGKMVFRWSYGFYLATCLEIVGGLDLPTDIPPLRRLDRALWKHDQVESDGVWRAELLVPSARPYRHTVARGAHREVAGARGIGDAVAIADLRRKT